MGTTPFNMVCIANKETCISHMASGTRSWPWMPRIACWRGPYSNAGVFLVSLSCNVAKCFKTEWQGEGENGLCRAIASQCDLKVAIDQWNSPSKKSIFQTDARLWGLPNGDSLGCFLILWSLVCLMEFLPLGSVGVFLGLEKRREKGSHHTDFSTWRFSCFRDICCSLQ